MKRKWNKLVVSIMTIVMLSIISVEASETNLMILSENAQQEDTI